ncbi:hypothetical protein [Turicibacter sanguinis]|uniref:hypothetical protein n=1 Tax=Turicibacter sanguinis TaxID=154288 RepID=UPI0018AA04AF|nr:hypothetical protein [Turicibacter sanguinis]MDB8552013.1 hypothetical protein [Turicibacter sanguinis]
MNEGQIELIQIISELEKTLEVISGKLEYTKDIKSKAKEIKGLSDSIIELAKQHEIKLADEKKTLEKMQARVSELHFEQLQLNQNDIAQLIIANLPDYIEKPLLEEKNGKSYFQLLKKEAVKTRKHELVYEDIILGEVWVGAENISEEGRDKNFTVAVHLNETLYSRADNKSFILQFPHRVYKTLAYIHVNTSYNH